MKNEMRSKITCLFLLSYVVFLSSAAWKNVGMTMTCNRCDAVNIMRRKIVCDLKNNNNKNNEKNNNNKQQQQQQNNKLVFLRLFV